MLERTKGECECVGLIHSRHTPTFKALHVGNMLACAPAARLACALPLVCTPFCACNGVPAVAPYACLRKKENASKACVCGVCVRVSLYSRVHSPQRKVSVAAAGTALPSGKVCVFQRETQIKRSRACVSLIMS